MFLSQYVDLKIKKNKVKFSASEKQKITNSAKALSYEGLIFFDEVENIYYPLVKFVKTGKRETVKGIKNPLLGRFIRGAKPNQKMRGNVILTPNAEKIFIPMDLSFIEEYNEEGEIYSEDEISDFVVETLYDVSILEKLYKSDYFSVVTANGWEIGRGNYMRRLKKPKTIDKKLQQFDGKTAAIVRKAEGQTGRKRKLESVSNEIASIIMQIFKKNVNRYKMGLQTISGIYLYKFVKQRQPTKAEKKLIKGKKKKGRK